jgi:tetratricopeptide (TPR) repeat protein
VQAILAGRIDRLPVEEKRLVECASVIGKEVPFALLQAVSDLPDGALRACLDELQAADLLYETSVFPDHEYTFKHSLTQEVAYGVLLEAQRRSLHGRVVEAIESLYNDRLAEHIDRLAEHALKGELWGKAATYLRQAGTKAFARSAYRPAAKRLEQALTALQQQPETTQRDEEIIDVRFDIRNALLPVGEVEIVIEHLRRARVLAEALNDKQRAGWAFGYLSACLWSKGDYSVAIELANRAKTLATELEDWRLQVYANLALSWPYHSVGDYRQGIRCGAEAVRLLEGPRLTERLSIPSLPSVLARTWLVSSLVELGEFPRAVALAEESLGLAEAVNEPWALADAYLGFGVLHLRRGDLGKAHRGLERGLDTCERFNIDVWLTPIAACLGYVSALSGSVTEGTLLLNRAVEQAGKTKLSFYSSLGRIWLSEAYLLAGEVEKARRLCCDALTACESRGELGNQAYALRLLGNIISAAPDVGIDDDAEVYIRDALTLAVNLEMRPLVAQCHLSLGNRYLQTRKVSESAQHILTSLELFRDLQMTYWVAQSENALHKLRA